MTTIILLKKLEYVFSTVVYMLQWSCFLTVVLTPFSADDIPELLSSSSLFSMLLPLIIAYIGPVAAAIPKVCGSVL